jgi:hypothetical protein
MIYTSFNFESGSTERNVGRDEGNDSLNESCTAVRAYKDDIQCLVRDSG